VLKVDSNNGFSLVELIIVIAIMAALVGVLAPQYVKYLEKTQRTRDCSAINTILDTCEVIALDPDTTWFSGNTNKITIVVNANGATYSGGAYAELNDYVPASDVKLESENWGPFTIYAIKDDDGRVGFDISDNSQIALLGKYSSVLSDRLE
jgi:type IV pilus assembly protein PilA